MYFGTYHHRLNAKSQVTVPARFRGLLPDKTNAGGEVIGKEDLYLFRPGRRHLYLLTQQEMERLFGELARRTKDSRDAEFERMFASRFTGVDMDSQGRIVISKELRESAGIEADVVFVGNRQRIEIWPLEEWKRFETERSEGFERELDEKLDDLFEC
jgi:MraZ protein